MPKGHVLTTSQRGYGWQHQVMRRRITRYKGPSHARFNERAARGLPVLAPQRPARALAFFDI